MKKIAKPLLAFIICIVVMAGSMGLASAVESDFGNVDVSTWYFEVGDEIITYKLYVPNGVSAQNPAPGVLLMHGYQNDKETTAAYGIELARRGIVALSIDEYGHGSTTIPMRERGYTYYTIKNPDKRLSGPTRYLTMLSFSTMDFLYDDISTGIIDSSMGGDFAYQMLGAFDFVDETRLGITGHSMGTWSSWTVGAHNQDHTAIVLQCGEIIPEGLYNTDEYKFNNVLLIQAKYDEFDYFRDYQPNVEGLEKTERRYKDFMLQDAPVNWNETYGSFSDGSARRMELLNTNHRLATHNKQALTAAMDWFVTALGADTNLAANDHIYMAKEVLVLIGMLAALCSMMPLLVMLTKTKLFGGITQDVPNNESHMMPKKSWWKNAIITLLISGLTFPFLTQLGHGLIPVPQNIFRMTVGNGFITWLTFLMIVALIMLLVWYRRGEGKRLGATSYDLGLSREADGTKVKFSLILKSLLLAVILVGTVYVFVTLSVAIFGLDFRFIWPFFKPFNGQRIGQFAVYLPFYLAFFLINGGAKLYGQMRRPLKRGPVATQLSWWLRSVLVMLGGVFLIVLVEYIPFFMGFGPGIDLLFGATFGGPFMSIMILMLPQFIVFFYLSTYFYRKTGLVYVGSMVTAMLATWVVTGGSALF